MDIETGERVEGELDAFIAKRDKQRRQTEGERRGCGLEPRQTNGGGGSPSGA